MRTPPTTNAATQAAPDAVLAFVSSPVANALDTAPVVTMPRNVHRKAALSQAAQAGPRTANSAVGGLCRNSGLCGPGARGPWERLLLLWSGAIASLP